MQLNHMQQIAVEMYAEWYKYPNKRQRPWFEISGAAGTGKTTVVREAMNYLNIKDDQIAFMAFIGKATLALKRSGVDAKTIHHFIYDIVKKPAIDDLGHVILERGRPRLVTGFQKKVSLPDNIISLVADEAGMIGDNIGNDILSFGLPLLALGDLNQLPPVMAKRMFLGSPDVTLNEIMRQAKDSPIIQLSQYATHGIPIPYGSYGDGIKVIRKNEMTEEDLVKADIIICGTNSMRDTINNYMRKRIYGIKTDEVVEGDKIICRQNKWNIMLNQDISLVNGLIGYVDTIYREPRGKSLMSIDFRPEFYSSEYFHKIPFDYKYPMKPYSERRDVNLQFNSAGVAFEYAHAITCHLAQGSQYPNVLVYVEQLGNSLYARQWLYTAITRAEKYLTLVI